MDHARKNIMRISKLLYIIAKIVVIVTILLIVGVTALSVISIFVDNQDLRGSVLDFLRSYGSLSMFGYFGLEESSDYMKVVIVGASFFFVMDSDCSVFSFYLTSGHIPKCIFILEAKISTTTGLEPRGRMMSAVRLVGSMNCWCMGFTKVW